ncbi:MAG: hypothetical protein ACREQC_12510 [Candidatus Binataceae bacterium]
MADGADVGVAKQSPAAIEATIASRTRLMLTTHLGTGFKRTTGRLSDVLLVFSIILASIPAAG